MLVLSGIGGETKIVVIPLACCLGGRFGLLVGREIGNHILSHGVVALHDEVVKVSVSTHLPASEEALGTSARGLGKKAADLDQGGWRAIRSAEFASEIGGAKAAAGGVCVGVAKAVGFGGGGLGAAASISKGEAADGEGGRDGGAGRHSESIANVNGIEK